MSEHILFRVAREFQKDEIRRRANEHKPRLQKEESNRLEYAIVTLKNHEYEPSAFIDRGLLALTLFGYEDSIEESAATVIADLLWALRAVKPDDPMITTTTIAKALGYFLEDVNIAAE